jgi:hypothetical protein
LACRDRRRRRCGTCAVGPAPVKAMFETVAVPLAPPGTPGVFYRGLRTVSFDGLNSVKVPGSGRNRSWLGKTMTCLGLAGYPARRIVALAETGTRGLPGAVIGGKGERSEVPLARKLIPLLREGMLLLAGRAYDAADLLKEAAATGAHVLVRGSAARKPPVLEILPRRVLPVPDRRPRGTDHRGRPGRARRRRDPARDGYRLITTLLDWRRNRNNAYSAQTSELRRNVNVDAQSKPPTALTFKCQTACLAPRRHPRLWPQVPFP